MTDLNFLGRKLLYCTDDIFPLYSLPNPRFESSRNPLPIGFALSSRDARAGFWSAPAVDLHGLREIVERLNSKPEALYHLGFRESVARSTLADANEKRDWRLWEALALSLIPNDRSLYAGEFWPGFGKHHLRPGFDDDRLVADDVSLGHLPLDQEWNQDEHSDRFEGSDTGLHLRVRSQHARCEVVGHVGVRIRSDLSFRQGLHRLCQTPAHRSLGSVFRYPRQRQPPFRAAKISCRGQNNRASERLGRVFGAAQSERKLSVSVEEDSVFRYRAKALFGVLDQPHGTFCAEGCQTLQEALGDRIVFQMGEGQFEDQALLWDEPQRGKNSDLDRCNDISAGSHPAQGAEIARKPPHNSANFEFLSVREDSFA